MAIIATIISMEVVIIIFCHCMDEVGAKFDFVMHSPLFIVHLASPWQACQKPKPENNVVDHILEDNTSTIYAWVGLGIAGT